MTHLPSTAALIHQAHYNAVHMAGVFRRSAMEAATVAAYNEFVMLAAEELLHACKFRGRAARHVASCLPR